MSKFFKNGELQDKQIVATLHKAAEDYENGEIVEVKGVLIDIINAITDFEQSYEETMKKYKKCTDCPRYRECVKTADLRRKRRWCKYADCTRAPKERSNHE